MCSERVLWVMCSVEDAIPDHFTFAFPVCCQEQTLVVKSPLLTPSPVWSPVAVSRTLHVTLSRRLENRQCRRGGCFQRTQAVLWPCVVKCVVVVRWLASVAVVLWLSCSQLIGRGSQRWARIANIETLILFGPQGDKIVVLWLRLDQCCFRVVFLSWRQTSQNLRFSGSKSGVHVSVIHNTTDCFFLSGALLSKVVCFMDGAWKLVFVVVQQDCKNVQ